jgi:methylenetetrahydrofolate--tRNA-(uracil-5-)-methyltransferase
MTGVEGYVESAASGLLAGLAMAAMAQGRDLPEFPQETAIGALGWYISGGAVGDFQPMNVNFGILTPLGYRVKGKAAKNQELSNRALAIIDQMVAQGL